MLDTSRTDADTTRIILSFAMVEHGGLFAHWLRDKLMKRYGLFSANSVYMDCVATRQLKTHHSLAKVDIDKLPEEEKRDTYVSPDWRPESVAQGYVPIGARNNNWNGMYEKAMSEASVMVMVVTPSYLDSIWCLQEWSQFQAERRRRPAFRGVGILLQGQDGDGLRTPDAVPLDKSGVRFITCGKVAGGPGHGLAWHKSSFDVSDSDLARIYREIGAI